MTLHANNSREVTITEVKQNLQKHINRIIQRRLDAVLDEIFRSTDEYRRVMATHVYDIVLDKRNYYKKVYRLFDLLDIEVSTAKWRELVESCNSVFWIKENFIKSFVLNPNTRNFRRVLKCYLHHTLDEYYYKRFASAFVSNYQKMEIHHEILDELMTSAGVFQDIIQEIA
jgi:hypothetical protein